MPGIALEIKRKCKVCGKVFLVKKLDSQFCSKRCSAVDLKRRRDAEVKEARKDSSPSARHPRIYLGKRGCSLVPY